MSSTDLPTTGDSRRFEANDEAKKPVIGIAGAMLFMGAICVCKAGYDILFQDGAGYITFAIGGLAIAISCMSGRAFGHSFNGSCWMTNESPFN